MMSNKTNKLVLTLLLGALILYQPLFVGAGATKDLGRLVHKKNSIYHQIFVSQRRSIVTLQFSKMPEVEIQSQVNLSDLRQLMLE
ncbi:MAG: hypothetical protein ACYTE8_09840, partial [Planctomycetota bacterium]